MNKLVPFEQISGSVPVEAVDLRSSTALGTAAWQQFAEGAVHPFSDGDLFLGYAEGGPVGMSDDRHVALTAGARGGKGASIIVQNLCSWRGSVVVVDPKGENAIVTARRRGSGSPYCRGMNQKVRILDPFNEVKTALDDFSDLKVAFNPLDLIDAKRDDAIGIAGRIADTVNIAEGLGDPYWGSAARSLNRGIILHVKSSWDFLPNERNLATVYDLVMQGDALATKVAQLQKGEDEIPSGYALLAKAMQRNDAFGGIVRQAGAMLANLLTSPKQFLGVIETLRDSLDFMAEPAMKQCLARSDFSLSDLKTDVKGMSLYLCLPERYKQTHYRWLRMMSALMIGEMEHVRQQPACGERVLMVLDEFPSLRRMQVIESAAAQLAGFGVKMMFVAQTLAQLKDTYKDNWETLLANCGVKIFFCNDDNFTREYVSKSIGEREVVRIVRSANHTDGTSSTEGFSFSDGGSASSGVSHSVPGGSSSNSSAGRSWSASRSSSFTQSQSDTGGQSETIHKRPLVTPDEVGRLFGNRDRPAALVLISGHQPLHVDRQYYFRTEELEGTYDAHPDHKLPYTVLQADVRRIARERLRVLLEAAAERERLHALEEERLERELQACLARLHQQQEERKRLARNALRRRKNILFWTIGVPFGIACAMLAVLVLFKLWVFLVLQVPVLGLASVAAAFFFVFGALPTGVADKFFEALWSWFKKLKALATHVD